MTTQTGRLENPAGGRTRQAHANFTTVRTLPVRGISSSLALPTPISHLPDNAPMAPRSKSTRQSKARSVSNSEPSSTAPLEQTVTSTSESIREGNATTSPHTPSSVSRTYAQAVRSAPPSPRREGTANLSASTSSRAVPSAPTAPPAEAGQDSLEGTAIRVRLSPRVRAYEY